MIEGHQNTRMPPRILENCRQEPNMFNLQRHLSSKSHNFTKGKSIFGTVRCIKAEKIIYAPDSQVLCLQLQDQLLPCPWL